MLNKNIWLLSSCQALMMTGNALLITSSALVGVSLATDAAFATLPLALQFMSTMLASIPASLLMGRIGRRAGFMLASFIGFGGALLATQAIIQHDFWQFCLATILIGSFNGFGNYYRFAAVEVVPESQKSVAISYVMAGGVIAAILGPNLANWSHDWISGYQFAGSFAVVSSFYVLSFILLTFARLPPAEARSGRQGSGRPLSQIIRQPVFIVALIGGMFGYAVMSLVMTATPLSMGGHHHGLSDTAFVIQWHVLGMFAPSFFTGNLIRRFGVINIMLAGALLLAACVVVNLLGTSLWHFWLALFFLGLGWNFLFIGATDLLTFAYEPAEKAKVQAVNDFSVFTAVTLAALTAGVLQHRFGWETVNIGVTPMIALILIALLWLRQVRLKTIKKHQVENAVNSI